MIRDGGLDLELDMDKLPREVKRSHVVMVAKIGAGAFGEVWKGMLDESSAGGVPGYVHAPARGPIALRPHHFLLRVQYSQPR